MKKHKVYLQELSAEFSEADYSKFYEVVMRRIENGELVPMKSAKNNGRKPALPLCFWEYEKEADYTELYEELKYRYHPRINTFYYREHPEYSGSVVKTKIQAFYNEPISVAELGRCPR